MTAKKAYLNIIYAINNIHDKKDKFLKRINKKSKRYTYFRVPEYEIFIFKDVKYSYLYARDIVHGQLPNKMHNFMLCKAIADPDNYFVKKYFQICKGNFPISTVRRVLENSITGK